MPKSLSIEEIAQLLERYDISEEEFSDDLDKDYAANSSDTESTDEYITSEDDEPENCQRRKRRRLTETPSTKTADPNTTTSADLDATTSAEPSSSTRPNARRRRNESNAQTESSSYTWSDTPSDPPNFPFTAIPGVNFQYVIETINVGELIDLFFSEDLWNLLVEETNRYAVQMMENKQIRRSSRITSWKETDTSEMKCFIGLLLHMGACKKPSVEHYWSTHAL